MRREPRLKLQRSPLVYVLAQVRFPAVLKMADHVPEIQDALRAQGFPRFEEEQIQQVVFGSKIQSEERLRWVCGSRDRREAAVLARDFVVYETSRYDVFETFLERFLAIIDIVKDQVGIEFWERLGLRYIDLIRDVDGILAAELLRESLRGLSAEDLQTSDRRQQFVVQGRASHCHFCIRSLENSGGRFMPSDVEPTHLDLGVKSLPTDEVFRVLDFDYFIRTTDSDFDSVEIEAKLWVLHDSIRKAFESAVTSKALEIWKAGGIE